MDLPTIDAGYFQILTQKKKILWNKREAILGRESSSPCENLLPAGDEKTMSRQHCKIFWDETKDLWILQVISKNGLHCDVEKLEQHDKVELSKNRPTSIRMGACKCYFCPPQV
eukprot:UN19479